MKQKIKYDRIKTVRVMRYLSDQMINNDELWSYYYYYEGWQAVYNVIYNWEVIK
jgi:hypothetical protein